MYTIYPLNGVDRRCGGRTLLHSHDLALRELQVRQLHTIVSPHSHIIRQDISAILYTRGVHQENDILADEGRNFAADL